MEDLVKAADGLSLNVDNGELMVTTINDQPSTVFPHEKLEAWRPCQGFGCNSVFA